jgi:formate hydrogenlyase subunit 3/multisubunit Na+/H+ antiporter MnhD subunit
MSTLFEAIMVICFGLSWPLSVCKSWKSRTAKGKSLLFELFIWLGYLSGIIGKIITDNITYVFIFYVINITMLSVDITLYIRNLRLDRETAK